MRAREGTSHPALRRRPRVRVRRRFNVPPQRVLAAWLDTRIARRWRLATATRPMHEVEIDARVDGAFRFVDRHGGIAEYRGRYTVLEQPSRLAFSLLHGDDRASHVTVEIAAHTRGCELVLTHDAVRGEQVDTVRDRWTGLMYGLAQLLDADDSNHRSER